MSEVDAGIIEAEAVEEMGQELVPTGPAPATLFRTDDPVEIVERATAVAKALSDVLKQQKLTMRIGQKDHVLVEGWTLCGSMLGVFPVVEWTRKLEDGWEARVEARTRDGAVVGAAEAECLRSEKRWKTADDYAVRSMAQTRAVSKALRAPLGFVVALAGFEATPAEEMPASASYSDPGPYGGEPAEPKVFDPDVHLAEGAIRGPNAKQEITAQLDRFDPTVDWWTVLAGVVKDKYDQANWRDLEDEDEHDFWRRLSNSVRWIENAVGQGDFPPVEAEKLVAGLAYGFSGIVVEIVYREVETPEAVKAGDAALSKEQQEASKNAPPEDVSFGEEKPDA